MTKKRKFLITGGTGFVGSCLARELVNSGNEVSLILRQSANIWRIKDIINLVKIYESDLSDINKLKSIFSKVNPDVVYHLATEGAYSHQNNPEQIFQTNIIGTLNMFRASHHINYELFINTGSSSEYGFKTSVMREGDVLEPNSYYAIAKSAQTLLSSYTAISQHKPIVTLRLFSVYGPYEEATRLIPTLLRSLFKNQPLDLVDPHVVRDFIYIDDVVEAFLKINELKNFTGEYFNVCSGVQISIKKIVEEAIKVTGRTTKFNWGGMQNRRWDAKIWRGDSSKIRKNIKWSYSTDLRSGLNKTWEWYKKNYKIYDH